MSPLVECPHCDTRVLPMAGRRCPACGKDVDAPPPPPPPPEPVVESVFGYAAEQMSAGAAPKEIHASLTRKGLDADAAAQVVDKLKRIEGTAKREAAQKHMLHGALWCIGGILVTTATYAMASGRGGGTFLVAWGAILFGGIQFFLGLSQWGKESS